MSTRAAATTLFDYVLEGKGAVSPNNGRDHSQDFVARRSHALRVACPGRAIKIPSSPTRSAGITLLPQPPHFRPDEPREGAGSIFKSQAPTSFAGSECPFR